MLQFLKDCLQYEIHSLHEYKVSQIPIIQDYWIPSFKNNFEAYMHACVFYSIHGICFQLLRNPPTKSWKETFEQLYPYLSISNKEIIKNIIILYERKELTNVNKLQQASKNDNNGQTDCDKYEHSIMDGLYDENFTNGQYFNFI